MMIGGQVHHLLFFFFATWLATSHTAVDYATNGSLSPNDPKSSCPYNSFSKVPALVMNLLVEVSDQQRGDVVFARNKCWMSFI